jgi:hypothetical protein
MVNSYRKVSIKLKVPKAPLYERIQLQIVRGKESSLTDVRLWYEDILLGIQKSKMLEV